MLIIVLLLSAIKELKLEVPFFLPLAPTVNYSFSSVKQMGILLFYYFTNFERKESKNVHTRRWADGEWAHEDSINAVSNNKLP